MPSEDGGQVLEPERSQRDHGHGQLLGRRRLNLSMSVVGMETAADYGAAVREWKG